ncbi:velvet factor-domain-containing protein [Sporodiniella umbellata]|nr:velvet factor-domain-containing protein [Sporodiniella umbellata]
MNNFSTSCTYRFIDSSIADISSRIDYNITIRQQPQRAKVSLVNERDRRPIEPPPILQLYWENATEEESKKCLQSPFYFMVANLVSEEEPHILLQPTQDYLSGTTVSSLHRLRDIDNSDGGFFVFGDLAVKKEGRFRLQFSLFEIVDGQVQNRNINYSSSFTVYVPKRFPGPVEATFLSRTFSDQGVKMRIRKEHRIQSRKRKAVLSTPTKKYSTKRYETTKTFSYAHTTTHAPDVYFGRWQATASTDPYQAISPPLSVEEDYHKSRHHDDSPAYYPTRLPTPPMVDHKDHWGIRLPPLRAIMNNDTQHSLILPPPVLSECLIRSRY